MSAYALTIHCREPADSPNCACTDRSATLTTEKSSATRDCATERIAIAPARAAPSCRTQRRPHGVDVGTHLRDERGDAGERALLPHPADDLELHLTPVEVAVEVEH